MTRNRGRAPTVTHQRALRAKQSHVANISRNVKSRNSDPACRRRCAHQLIKDNCRQSIEQSTSGTLRIRSICSPSVPPRDRSIVSHPNDVAWATQLSRLCQCRRHDRIDRSRFRGRASGAGRGRDRRRLQLGAEREGNARNVQSLRCRKEAARYDKKCGARLVSIDVTDMYRRFSSLVKDCAKSRLRSLGFRRSASCLR
jgi:hypothetical protein